MNTRDLHELLRAGFSCINGVPRAYMEIRIPLLDQQIHLARFVYQTVGVTMRGEAEDIEPILCAWMWQRLVAAFPKEEMEDRNVLLIFRRWPQIEGYTDGDGYAATKLTTRLVIPGDDLKRIFGGAAIDEGQMLFQL